MVNDSLTVDVSARICLHMNNDHQEALIAYAKHYGGFKTVNEAKMIWLSNRTMELEVDGNRLQIDFDHRLTDREDAHKTLIAMLRSIPEGST